MPNCYGWKPEGCDDAKSNTELFYPGGVFIVIDSQWLEGRLETMIEMYSQQDESQHINRGVVPYAEYSNKQIIVIIKTTSIAKFDLNEKVFHVEE